MRSLFLVFFAGVSLVLSVTANALITVGALDQSAGVPRDVEVVGDLAYVADGHAGLRIIDFASRK